MVRKAFKSIVVIIAVYVIAQLVFIIGGCIIDVSAIMFPSNDKPITGIKKTMNGCSDWFHEQSGRSDAEREKAYNESGLYYNEATGEYEEDQERFSKELDMKYRGKVNQ